MLRSRRLQAFVAILCLGGLVGSAGMAAFSIRPLVYWSVVLGLALTAAFFMPKPDAGTGVEESWRKGAAEFLCDDCRYNDARYCGRPERPNATRCPDHAPRSS